MPPKLRRALIAGLALTLAALLARHALTPRPGHVQAPPDDEVLSEEAALRVLFIGNSLTHTYDVDRMTEALLEAAPDGPGEVLTYRVAPPGARLTDHAAALEREGAPLRYVLRDGPPAVRRWDVVVIQEQSQTPRWGEPSGTFTTRCAPGDTTRWRPTRCFASSMSMTATRAGPEPIWPRRRSRRRCSRSPSPPSSGPPRGRPKGSALAARGGRRGHLAMSSGARLGRAGPASAPVLPSPHATSPLPRGALMSAPLPPRRALIATAALLATLVVGAPARAQDARIAEETRRLYTGLVTLTTTIPLIVWNNATEAIPPESLTSTMEACESTLNLLDTSTAAQVSRDFVRLHQVDLHDDLALGDGPALLDLIALLERALGRALERPAPGHLRAHRAPLAQALAATERDGALPFLTALVATLEAGSPRCLPRAPR